MFFSSFAWPKEELEKATPGFTCYPSILTKIREPSGILLLRSVSTSFPTIFVLDGLYTSSQWRLVKKICRQDYVFLLSWEYMGRLLMFVLIGGLLAVVLGQLNGPPYSDILHDKFPIMYVPVAMILYPPADLVENFLAWNLGITGSQIYVLYPMIFFSLGAFIGFVIYKIKNMIKTKRNK